MSNSNNGNGNKPNPLNVPRGGRFETDSVRIEGDRPIALDEIRQHNDSGGFEVESIKGVNAHSDALALEAFMNETVMIIVAEDGDEEALQVITAGVNGITQPIVRGQPTPVKRKYIEALARAKETRYRQVQKDASDPTSLVMEPRTSLAYPFAVEQDTPDGRAWLRDLLKQRA